MSLELFPHESLFPLRLGRRSEVKRKKNKRREYVCLCPGVIAAVEEEEMEESKGRNKSYGERR